MPFANDLLEQARHLANREPQRPRQASLRRAVSTTYYSLFHLLITASVSHWRIPRQRTILARHFNHKTMSGTCTRVLKMQKGQAVAPHVQQLRNVAKAFKELQQHRHDADYDNSKNWTRTQVIQLIDLAQAAFDDWRLISDQQIAQDFLLELFATPRQD